YEQPSPIQQLFSNSLKLFQSLLYLPYFLFNTHNALLRGEQRNTDAAVCHLKHLNQRIVKMPRVANPS
ncbi:hypothetical protein O4N72_24150, partial [Vibrio parahaemolyticus]|uniref:hypothetical protein n=1 Tax=Vibrio parahaemolyticus TaxID=670 RepID=UPI0022B4DE52